MILVSVISPLPDTSTLSITSSAVIVVVVISSLGFEVIVFIFPLAVRVIPVMALYAGFAPIPGSTVVVS